VDGGKRHPSHRWREQPSGGNTNKLDYVFPISKVMLWLAICTVHKLYLIPVHSRHPFIPPKKRMRTCISGFEGVERFTAWLSLLFIH
jgi:hypothetical protein